MSNEVEKEKTALLVQYGDARGVWEAFERREINRRSKYRKQAFEEIIAPIPNYAYWYARYVLKGPFKLGEPAIAKHFYQNIYIAFFIRKRNMG